MIRVRGGPGRLCDGWTRRDWLRVSSSAAIAGAGAGAWGMSPGIARGAGGGVGVGGALPPENDFPHFGRAKSCILLFLYGSHSQIETFDPKPDAPVGIRGELGTIDSNVPGMALGEGLPRLSRVMDKVTVLRSVTHPFPVHGVAYAATGIESITVPMELNPRDPGHWPFMGSVVDYCDRRGSGGGSGPESDPTGEIPNNLLLPWPFSSRRVGEVPRAGPYGGFLGPGFDPVACEFLGEGTRKAKKTLTTNTWEDYELYRGITPESRFALGVDPKAAGAGAGAGASGGGVALDRLDRRRSLLRQVEDAWRDLELNGGQDAAMDRQRAQAMRLLGSPKLRRAFDLDEETPETRDLYGMTLFGQGALTARRLVEAGGRFVTLFWDEFGLAGSGWDTHWDHYPRMRDELLPGLDQALSGLLIDLDRRGMMDETLVLLLSEHGRTPQLANVNGGGRDHWSRCYSLLMAGAGIGRGRVVGRSDRIAGDVLDRPISPKDVLATAYHLLGIRLDTMLSDRQGRPLPIVPRGRVIPEALA